MSKSLYVTLALVLGALVASATGSLGKKLEIALDSSGKPKNLSVAYAYDANWGWYLTTATTLKSTEIIDVPEKISMQLIDQSSGKVYASQDVSKKTLLSPTMMVKTETVLREFLPKQKDAALVFRSAKGENLYYLPLSDACSYSANVSNLSKTGNPACAVDPGEFTIKTSQCDDQQAKLLQYVSLGYITCSAAKEIYSKMGCGDLPCK